MPLIAGARLGPFEIVAPLGAGGMGEVYRARDTRLGREVAVKVLSRHLSVTPEVRARFEREAKTVSALNHPHICVLHDIGREGDTDYLVMELVEGETLAARLAHGAIAPPEVLKLGAQIADALDRAHRAGVVHRDLKPGNVMLTRSGAKLMDFGLARAAGGGATGAGSGAASASALTQSPTMTTPLTAEGAIVGTFQYMAPEQLEGGEPDTRSDLWALGCVLYEMATGRRAFEGKSQASLIAAIMHVDPQPVSRLAPLSPPALDRLVAACLAKDPADRVQSAHDVKLQLGWIAEGPAAGVAAAQAPERRATAWIVPTRIALVALLASAPAHADSPAMDRAAPDTAAMRVVMLGTGTPNADPERSGPAVAVVAGGRAYLVDCGPGVVRRAAAAARAGIPALEAERLSIVFVTHLHSDHTLGLPDLMLSPWVLERRVPLEVHGPPGIRAMTSRLLAAYEEDIRMRQEGLEPDKHEGWRVNAHDVRAGVVYRDSNVTVTAIAVPHANWKHAFGYRFESRGRVVVISGDTRPSDSIVRACDGCDVLVHEVYSGARFRERPPEWQRYHADAHTSTAELGALATRARPKLLVLYHQLLWGATDDDLVREVRSGYAGAVVSARDLGVYP